MTARCEQETVVRWTPDESIAHLWTANPAVFRKWTRVGYPVTERHGSWWAEVPIACISFRRERTEAQKARDAARVPVTPFKRRVTQQETPLQDPGGDQETT